MTQLFGLNNYLLDRTGNNWNNYGMFEPLRDQPLEIHITVGDLLDGDLQLFFGQPSFPDDGQSRSLHFHFPEKIDWQTLGLFLKWFPSKSQAMKAGWNGPLPQGYSEHRKKLIRLYVLNFAV